MHTMVYVAVRTRIKMGFSLSVFGQCNGKGSLGCTKPFPSKWGRGLSIQNLYPSGQATSRAPGGETGSGQMAPNGPVRVPLGHQETFSALCFDSGARIHAHLDASNAERATVRACGPSLTGLAAPR